MYFITVYKQISLQLTIFSKQYQYYMYFITVYTQISLQLSIFSQQYQYAFNVPCIS